MSTLTKIAIVVLVVLCIAVAAATVSAVTYFQNYKVAYASSEARANAMAAQAQLAELNAQKVIRQRDDLQTQFNELQNSSASAQQKRDGEIDRLKSANDEQAARLTSISGELEKLRLSHEQNVAMRTTLAANLDAARTTIDKLNAENRQTGEALKNTLANVDRQDKVVKLLREELADRDNRIRTLEETVATKGATAAPAGTAVVTTPDGGANITGTISVLRNNLAGINVGSAQGVKSGMKFYIYRGGDFVGFLRVDEVHPSDAAGVLVDKKLDPMIGDKVATSLKQ